MSENLVLDKSFASASGVLLISNGEIVEFFPRASNGKDLGLSDDAIVLTESDEAVLAETLQEFAAKIKYLNEKMQNDQKEIDRLKIESAKTLNRIESSLQKLEAFVG
jgi:peptidoglycan hydrolase CwlO-like protein